MRVVLDTNVILSGLLWEGIPKRCVDAYRFSNIYQLILSPEIIHELRTKLTQKFKMPDKLARQWEKEITPYAYLVVPKNETTICRDPKDNMILDTAISANAQYIVTGDEDLLTLKEYKGILIVTPRQFLSVLGKLA